MRAGFLVIAALVIVAACTGRAVSQAADLPLDSSVYELLDDLARAGLLPSRVAGLRPLPRTEVARLLDEAERLARSRELSPVLAERLRRTTAEWHTEMRIYRRGLEGITLVKPANELRLTVRGDGAHREFEHDLGRSFDEGTVAYASFDSEARLFGGLTVAIRPEFRYERLFGTGDGTSGPSAHLLESYARASFLGLDLTVGRQALRWGQGHHDSLILSDNAVPLPAARLSSNYTSLSALGPARGELFLARLERDRAVPRALLGGMKLNFKPWPWLELGFSRTFEFGGKGRTIPFRDILFPSSSSENRTNDRDRLDPSNQLAGFDWRVQPGGFLEGLVLYGEAIGEDIETITPGRYSYVMGFELGEPLGVRDVSLVTELTWTHPLAYVHNVYRDGYTYRGELLGHHVGQDAGDMFVGLTWDMDAITRFTLGYDREESNRTGRIFEAGDPRHGISPVTDELRFGVRRALGRRIDLQADLRWARLEDFGFEEGRTEWDLLWQISLNVRF